MTLQVRVLGPDGTIREETWPGAADTSEADRVELGERTAVSLFFENHPLENTIILWNRVDARDRRRPGTLLRIRG